MNVKTCRKCRKLFNYVMGPFLCPACREAAEAKFQEVKKYIQENRRCGIQEVAEACEVSTNQIQQWLREERLMLADDSPMGIACEKCGKMIKSGKFCPACSNEMAASFQAAMGNPLAAQVAAKQEADRANARMRFFDK